MNDNANYVENVECGCGGVGTVRYGIACADRWYVRCTKCGISTSEYETRRQAIDAFVKATRQNECEEQKYVLEKFKVWWSEDCPYKLHKFCPCIDELRKDFEDEFQADEQFDVLDCCNHSQCEGDCWIEYYKQNFKNKKLNE